MVQIISEEQFPDWFANLLVDCVNRGGDQIPTPGSPLNSDQQERGEELARNFLTDLTLPETAVDCGNLYPRLWVVHGFVANALGYGTEPWKGVGKREFLEPLMIDLWGKHGRGMWEQMADS